MVSVQEFFVVDWLNQLQLINECFNQLLIQNAHVIQIYFKPIYIYHNE